MCVHFLAEKNTIVSSKHTVKHLWQCTRGCYANYCIYMTIKHVIFKNLKNTRSISLDIVVTIIINFYCMSATQ